MFQRELISPLQWASAYRDLAARSLEQARPNIGAIGWVGFIGFPLYYFVWYALVPQSYENLSLRMAGAILCLGLALNSRWPRELRGLFPAYWFFSVFFCLPFFFNYMLIRNEFSVIWLLSNLISVVLLVMLVDWLSSLLLFTAGTVVAATFAYYNGVGNLELLARYGEYLPIFIFALIAGSIFNYKSELLRRERHRAAHEFGQNLARELRPSLNGMRAGMLGLAKFMPDLLRAYQIARNSNLPVPNIERRELVALEGVVERIRLEAEHVNTLFEMASADARNVTIDPNTFNVRSIADCVDAALQTYPFRSDRERQRIVWKRDGDFSFLGNDSLMIRVLMMLIKNSLYSVTRAGKGEISIRIGTGAEENYLFIRETGFGIPAAQTSAIFEGASSYVDPTIASSGGLAFCKAVVEGFSGEIFCRSEYGRFTEFQLHLPAVKRSPLRAVPRVVA
ncbi:MAG: HAMP domain-containing histidine kinase [Alphaproteobacteria bacterium]|nr:HAMP domain-containing histidine kinase [Alphaproteobacteria bacterium]